HRSQSGRQLAKTQACRRPVRPPAAEILMTLTTTAAATVVTAALPAAAGASEHAPAWTHADLEHGSGTQRRIRDPHILDHRAFDVEKLFEYAVHQAPAAG
ncbi:hypothetical protein, partial [Bifidobacterium longum]